MMDRKSKDTDDESKKAIEEFLAKGGKIQYFEYGEHSEAVNYTAGFYGKKKKKEDE